MKEPNDVLECPLRKKYGEFICIDGSLWALTYSECAPPDQRQYWGPCSYCNKSPLSKDTKL